MTVQIFAQIEQKERKFNTFKFFVNHHNDDEKSFEKIQKIKLNKFDKLEMKMRINV